MRASVAYGKGVWAVERPLLALPARTARADLWHRKLPSAKSAGSGAVCPIVVIDLQTGLRK